MFAIFSVTFDRAPGNSRFTATNAVLDLFWLRWRNGKSLRRNAILKKEWQGFFKKVGYVLQCVTMLAQSATKNLQSVKVQGLQN